MPNGMCLNTVFMCPYCKCIHGGKVADGLKRECDGCIHRMDCEYNGYADIEERLCGKDDCFFQWFLYNAPVHMNIGNYYEDSK